MRKEIFTRFENYFFVKCEKSGTNRHAERDKIGQIKTIGSNNDRVIKNDDFIQKYFRLISPKL